MDISIIGIQGVGMAHAMAAERLGHKVVAVFDPSPKAKQRLAGEWVNQWGNFRQTITPRHRPELFESAEAFDQVSADLLIVACPTEYHLPYVRRYYRQYRHVLCEKPLAYDPADIASLPREAKGKLYVGHCLLLHPLMPEKVGRVCTIRYSHGYPPEEAHKRDCGVWWDMGTHCIAAMLRYVPQNRWSRIQCVSRAISSQHAVVTYSVGQKIFTLEAAYSPHSPGFFIDGTQLTGGDAFAEQLRAIEAGTHPASYRMGYQITCLARSVFSPEELLAA